MFLLPECHLNEKNTKKVKKNVVTNIFVRNAIWAIKKPQIDFFLQGEEEEAEQQKSWVGFC